MCDIIHDRGEYERYLMYDRHKPIIKWYEYDASKLYKTAEAEDVTQESAAPVAAPVMQAVEEPVAAPEPVQESVTGDPSMDDEVARIMAAFSGAKQNSVDDVFAAMAAQETADDAGTEEDLISSICAPKQNNVDDLVAMARNG